MFDELILEDRVSGRLYTDEEIFRLEMDRVFHRGWVFVGHASEVPEPGDFVTRELGLQPVVLIRGADGAIRLFANRCPHRGAEVCVHRSGQTRFFRCPYHGWTFDTEGALVGLPQPDGYPDDLDRSELGLSSVPRVAAYRGFVFGSWAEEGPDLATHLGNGGEIIDQLCDLSPVGEVSVSAGWLRHRVPANWKIIAENVCDFYHPSHTHASSRLSPAFFRDGSGSLALDLGGGHSRMDFEPAQAERPVRPLDQFTGPTRTYLERLAERDGPEGAVRRRRIGAPHGLVFPNLFVAGNNLFVLQPRGVGETSHLQAPVAYVGMPEELNERQLRRFEGASGPAGMLEADDAAVWARVQRGLAAREPEWVLLQRGADREVEADGRRRGRMLDETALRGFWRHYLHLLSAEPRIDAL